MLCFCAGTLWLFQRKQRLCNRSAFFATWEEATGPWWVFDFYGNEYLCIFEMSFRLSGSNPLCASGAALQLVLVAHLIGKSKCNDITVESGDIGVKWVLVFQMTCLARLLCTHTSIGGGLVGLFTWGHKDKHKIFKQQTKSNWKLHLTVKWFCWFSPVLHDCFAFATEPEILAGFPPGKVNTQIKNSNQFVCLV